MRLTLVTSPSVEPVSLSLAKQHCRVEITDDDAYITSLITAARVLCEQRSHLAFVNQTWDAFLDTWDDDKSPYTDQVTGFFWSSNQTGSTLYTDTYRHNQILLPRGPVSSVTWVKYYDPTATQQTWSSSNYVVSTGNPGRIGPVENVFFPPIAMQNDSINVRYVVGYGPDGTTTPQPAIWAILMTIAHLYKNRVAIADVSGDLVPLGVDDLLSCLGVGSQLFA